MGLSLSQLVIAAGCFHLWDLWLSPLRDEYASSVKSVAAPLERLGRFEYGTCCHLLGRFGYGAVVVFVTLLPRNSLSQVSLGDIEPGYHGGPEIETGTSTTWNFWLPLLRGTFRSPMLRRTLISLAMGFWLLSLYERSWLHSLHRTLIVLVISVGRPRSVRNTTHLRYMRPLSLQLIASTTWMWLPLLCVGSLPLWDFDCLAT